MSVGLAIVTALAAGISAEGPQDSLGVREHMLVSTAWLADHLDDSNVIVVYVARTRTNYERGHIPGARLLAWSEIAEERGGILNEVPPVDDLVKTVRRLGISQSQRIVLYDDSQGISAARAYVVFDYLGLGDRTALLDGHWAKWKSEKRPISTEQPRVEPSDFQPGKLRPEVVVSLAEMQKIVARKGRADAGPAIMDARSSAEYCGAVAGENVPKGGHIPGAENLTWSRNYKSSEFPVLRPAAELRKVYTEAGLKPGDEAIVYCRTGASASVDYFVSKYLGYRPRLYDGSFSEWSSQPNAEVVRGLGTIHVTVTESGREGGLPCRAWVDVNGERFFRPVDKSCVPYEKDHSFSCPGEFSIQVPPGKVTVHVERGKEYWPVKRQVKVKADRTVDAAVELRRWIDMAEQGWYSADWHVHFGVNDPAVMRQQALADDVNVLPVLGLWNQNRPDWPFPPEEAVIKPGERYLISRRNQEIERIGGGPFESVGAPLMYGLTRPVYVDRLEHTWPPDAILVRQAKAHSPDCVVDTDKPTWGENVVTAAFGLFDSAQVCHNHYNRGRTIPAGWGMAGAGVEEWQRNWGDDELFIRTNLVYYRFLNCGFRLAATGGSAMGVMPAPLGYSRTYAKLAGPITEEAYLEAVRQGRTFATSGPMLLLTVNDQLVGSTITAEAADDQPLRVVAELRSIQPVDSIEIVQNGLVIKRIGLEGRQPSPVLVERAETRIRLERSGWVAARAIFHEGPDHQRQAHTSPVYIVVDGKPVAFKRDARYMIRWIDELLDLSMRPDRYPSESDRDRARALFREARGIYERIVQTAEQVWGD